MEELMGTTASYPSSPPTQGPGSAFRRAALPLTRARHQGKSCSSAPGAGWSWDGLCLPLGHSSQRIVLNSSEGIGDGVSSIVQIPEKGRLC